MDGEGIQNWDEIIDVCYKVADSQVGKGLHFVETLSKALKVAGEYQVG